MSQYDFIVIGGGIAGASAAFALAKHGKVILLERESQTGYHSTGRSAALYDESYGSPMVTALTLASRAFLEKPPAGFAEYPVLSPRGVMLVGRAGEERLLDRAAEDSGRFGIEVRRLDAGRARAMVPVLRSEYVACALLEPGAMDIDVHGLHQGFLRGVRRQGSTIVTDAEVQALERSRGVWTATTPRGSFAARVVVNAAGAWCDRLAALAGAKAIKLMPKRRTAFVFDPPEGVDVRKWPLVADLGETFYFKPDAGRILASPADQTPVEPCDAQPEDIDIAAAVERISQAADLPVKHINRKWAGLRSFVAGESPVVGYDPEVEGFFWLAGQGGFGIKTSPAMSRLCASLVLGHGVEPDLAALGVTEPALSPARLRAS